MLLLAGVIATTIGVLLSRGGNLPSPYAAVCGALSPVTLVLGLLLFMAGVVVLCVAASPGQLSVAGLLASTVVFAVIPTVAWLLDFKADVHGTTGLLWVIWFCLCIASPAVLTVGVMRFMARHSRGNNH